MSYYIDLKAPETPIACTYEASVAAPGKTLLVNEQQESMVVEPDGTQVRWMPRTDPEGRFDSAYTQGTELSGFLMFRSASGDNKGTPRAIRMIR